MNHMKKVIYQIYTLTYDKQSLKLFLIIVHFCKLLKFILFNLVYNGPFVVILTKKIRLVDL